MTVELRETLKLGDNVKFSVARTKNIRRISLSMNICSMWCLMFLFFGLMENYTAPRQRVKF